MTIRTKLLLYFLTLSTLILIVGLIFYVQLKYLIEPLTPQSIPQSVEKLEKSINKNEFIFRILFQYQITKKNIENYILTKNEFLLKDFYMNRAVFYNIIEQSQRIYPEIWQNIDKATTDVDKMWDNMIVASQQNFNHALAILSSSSYITSAAKVYQILNQLYIRFDISHDETAIVTVKLASKNTRLLLLNSLNTTFYIFLNAILISLLFAFYSTRSISEPIDLLRENMDQISSQDLSIPIRHEFKGLKGEIGDLARSFETLISKLRTTTVSRDQLIKEIERRIQSEEQLRQTALDLEETNRDLDQFAYSASHDLRAPLRGIESLSDWITEDCEDILPEKSKKHLKLLKNRVRRLDNLINGILNYSRAAKFLGPVESIDLNTLIRDILDDLNYPEHIKISIDFPLPILVTSKPAITQVFMNLITNAIKFNDKTKGFINIGYRMIDNYYEFYVKDNGMGIDPQFHHKIFEIFQTLHSRDMIESAGIGLALVKKVVEKQNGRVWVESEVGKGSTFYFTWPKS